MKSLTVYSRGAFVLFLACLCPILGHGQTYTDAIETMGIAQSATTLSNNLAEETAKETAITAETAAMYGQFHKMRKWQTKYNQYMTTVAGYADALRAGSSLVSEAVRTFVGLKDVGRAIGSNPEDIASTAMMNNLYIEVAVELMRTIRIYNYAISKGGRQNMLNGAERTELLWTINDAMAQLNNKLHSLALSIGYFNMVDVWNYLTAGMLDKSHGQIAREAFARWHRASLTPTNLNLGL